MKLIKKVVNEIIEEFNETLKLEDPSEYLEEEQEYIERLNRMIKKSRIPFVDDDADVDEVIEVMAGLNYGYGVQPSDIDGFCFTGTGEYGFEQSIDVEAENIEYNVCYYMMYSEEKGKYVEYYAYPPVETPDSPDTPEEPVTTRPVYFANRRWDMTNKKMHVYGFVTSENNVWPGEEMSLSDQVEHLYYFEINTKYTTLVFNNGQDGNQTKNVSLFEGYNEEQGLVFYNVETDEWEEVPTEIPAPQYDDIGVITCGIG